MSDLKERVHDDKNGLDYVLIGDYYYPDLRFPEADIGCWGRAHQEYLRKEKPGVYAGFLNSGKLTQYLIDINRAAEQRCELLIRQMKEDEHITEELKAQDCMKWAGLMNSIRNRAEEIIKNEIIFC